MAGVSKRLVSFLDDHGVPYEIIPHRRDYTAQMAAADTHTPGKEFAKAVLLKQAGDYLLAVLPAHRRVDLERLERRVGGVVDLADEHAIGQMFPDCEVGAEPPFGNLYDLPTLVSRELTGDESITFNSGSHQEAIRMAYADFQRLVMPEIADFTVPADPAPQVNRRDE